MNILKSLLSVVFIIGAMSFSFGQVDFEKAFFEHYPKEIPGISFRTLQSQNTFNYDVVYCKLELNVDPAYYYVTGKATTTFIPTEDSFNEIYFDFTSQIDVLKVTFNGELVTFIQINEDELKIDFPQYLNKGELYEVVIEYAGQPASSGFGSFAIATQCGEQEIPSMWTLSEPYGAKHWWPCKQTLNDKYDSLDIIITTPERYRGASNGLLTDEVENNDGTKTYTWKHRYPIPAYLAAFAVSEYEVYSDWTPLENGDSLEILNYIFPCNLGYAQSRTPNTIPIMLLFRELFGEYPYIQEKYGHCNFGWGGGMEHSTMSFMGGFSWGLIAHELAHQWFGDKITCGSWQDIWLNEGFATYLEGLTYDFGAAPDSWENWKQYNQNRATNDLTRSVFVEDTTSVNRIFNGSLSYAKGAYLLHMLRFKMGDEDFFKAINNYIHDPELAYNYARTPDLQNHLEEVSGLDLDEFFNDWLYGGGYPVYEIIWEKTNSGFWLRINQTPTNPGSVDFFNMPVPIRLNGFNVDTTVVLDPQFSGQLFNLDIPFVVLSVDFDPEKWICAKSVVTTGIEESVFSDIKVYPNPSAEVLKVENNSSSIEQIKLFDALGREVYSRSHDLSTKLISIDVSSFSSGIYSLQIYGGNKQKSFQVIIE